MRGLLGVRITDGDDTRLVTRHVRSLSFRRSVPGGYAAASLVVALPNNTFRDLGPADKLHIYDTRTGRVVWQGFTDNPGVANGPGGQQYDLSASGTMILMGDESRALNYVDRDQGRWQEMKYASSAPSATAQTASDPTAPDTTADPPVGALCQMNPGQPVGTLKVATTRYMAFEESGMPAGGIFGSVKSGKIDTLYRAQVTTRALGGGAESNTNLQGLMITTAPSSFALAAPSGISDAQYRLELRLVRTGGATNVADDDTWSFFYDLGVMARLVDRNGSPLDMTAATTRQGLYAHEVVEDLLGRVMSFADKTASTIGTGSVVIDQLAYPDGATVQEVLDDLTRWEPDLLWELLEDTGSGYRFNFRAWPTTPRYEITTRDGYEAPGSDVDLCNRIAVFWTDLKGAKRTTVVTTAVPELGSRVKDAEPVELPDGLGSEANAQRIGSEILASKANPPTAATATVRRPLIDLLAGREVMPWEIEPGYLVRVRETGEDLRLTEVEYDDADCAATLTLGTPVLSEEQRIARLSSRRR